MQDINNDMDDLFRQAADRYPLKTGKGDWDKVFAGLQEQNTPSPATGNEDKKRRRTGFLFWLLPLLLAGAVSLFYFNTTKTGKQLAGAPSPEQPQAQHSNRASTSRTDTNVITALSRNKATEENPLSAADGKGNYHPQPKTETTTQLQKGNDIPAPEQKAITAINHTRNHQTWAVSVTGKHEPAAARDTSRSGKQNNNRILPGTAADNLGAGNNNATGIDNESLPQGKRAEEAAGTNKYSPERKLLPDSNAITPGRADSALPPSATAGNTAQAPAKKTATANVSKRFYGGLSFGIDVSSVKLQRVSRLGYTTNALFGYQFSKRFSAEAGIGWTEKHYYSTGEFFDKTKTGIPDAVTIFYTDGVCKMYELPVAVKYDFAFGKTGNFFAKAGLTSYLMNRETYSYHADFMSRIYDTTLTYKHSGNNWFSVAALGAGYQMQVNRKTALRAEAYFRVPLGGVGIARMPISSTGVMIGFTRSL